MIRHPIREALARSSDRQFALTPRLASFLSAITSTSSPELPCAARRFYGLGIGTAPAIIGRKSRCFGTEPNRSEIFSWGSSPMDSVGGLALIALMKLAKGSILAEIMTDTWWHPTPSGASLASSIYERRRGAPLPHRKVVGDSKQCILPPDGQRPNSGNSNLRRDPWVRKKLIEGDF